MFAFFSSRRRRAGVNISRRRDMLGYELHFGGVVRGRVTRVSNSGFLALEESMGGLREASRGSIFLAFLASA